MLKNTKKKLLEKQKIHFVCFHNTENQLNKINIYLIKIISARYFETVGGSSIIFKMIFEYEFLKVV